MSIYLGDTLIASNHPNAANQSLSNLNETGEKHFLNKNQITNCILEIPQDIKLELSGNTITLKAGSKVYIPNGFEQDGTTPKFDSVITSSDISTSASWISNPCMIALNSSQTGTYSFILDNQYSGSSAPTSLNTGTIWYDTTNNIIKRYNGSTWDSGISFPLCVATMVSGTGWTSIDQVFNGFGYIGSTVFALPGIKYLTPAGRNADGTLKNIEHTTDKVFTYYNTVNTWRLILEDTGFYGRNVKNVHYVENTLPSTLPDTYYHVAYKYDENLWYDSHGSTTANWTVQSLCPVGTASYDSNKVSSLTPDNTFHAISRHDINHITETYINGTSWYRVYSDGWCEQGGRYDIGYNTGSIDVTIYLVKYLLNSNYTVTISGARLDNNVDALSCLGISNMTTNSFKVRVAEPSGWGAQIRCIYWHLSGFVF